MSWQNFEKEAQKFIKNKIEIPDIKIEFTGGSNSNDKDIKIYKKSNLLFNIEIKSTFTNRAICNSSKSQY